MCYTAGRTDSFLPHRLHEFCQQKGLLQNGPLKKEWLDSPEKGCAAILFALSLFCEKTKVRSVYRLRNWSMGNCMKRILPEEENRRRDLRGMFEVLVYGYLCGISSSCKLEETCRYRVDFMWLLGDENVPDHTTLARFCTGRCQEVLEDLFYQLIENWRICERQITRRCLRMA